MAGAEERFSYERPTLSFIQHQRGSIREASFSPQPEDANRCLSPFRSSFSRAVNIPFSRDLEFATFFRKCSSEFIESLQDHFPTVFIESGQTIISEGNIGDYLYVVRHGEVDVEVRWNDIDTMNESDIPIKTLQSGDVFGEVTVLPKASVASLRPLCYTARTVCICRKVSRAALNQILKRFPGDKAYMEAMAQRSQAELIQKGNLTDLMAGADWRRAQESGNLSRHDGWGKARRISGTLIKVAHAMQGRRASAPGASAVESRGAEDATMLPACASDTFRLAAKLGLSLGDSVALPEARTSEAVSPHEAIPSSACEPSRPASSPEQYYRASYPEVLPLETEESLPSMRSKVSPLETEESMPSMRPKVSLLEIEEALPSMRSKMSPLEAESMLSTRSSSTNSSGNHDHPWTAKELKVLCEEWSMNRNALLNTKAAGLAKSRLHPRRSSVHVCNSRSGRGDASERSVTISVDKRGFSSVYFAPGHSGSSTARRASRHSQ